MVSLYCSRLSQGWKVLSWLSTNFLQQSSNFRQFMTSSRILDVCRCLSPWWYFQNQWKYRWEAKIWRLRCHGLWQIQPVHRHRWDRGSGISGITTVAVFWSCQKKHISAWCFFLFWRQSLAIMGPSHSFPGITNRSSSSCRVLWPSAGCQTDGRIFLLLVDLLWFWLWQSLCSHLTSAGLTQPCPLSGEGGILSSYWPWFRKALSESDLPDCPHGSPQLFGFWRWLRCFFHILFLFLFSIEHFCQIVKRRD